MKEREVSISSSRHWKKGKKSNSFEVVVAALIVMLWQKGSVTEENS